MIFSRISSTLSAWSNDLGSVLITGSSSIGASAVFLLTSCFKKSGFLNVIFTFLSESSFKSSPRFISPDFSVLVSGFFAKSNGLGSSSLASTFVLTIVSTSLIVSRTSLVPSASILEEGCFASFSCVAFCASCILITFITLLRYYVYANIQNNSIRGDYSY